MTSSVPSGRVDLVVAGTTKTREKETVNIIGSWAALLYSTMSPLVHRLILLQHVHSELGLQDWWT
jgi:hypothetical protein